MCSYFSDWVAREKIPNKRKRKPRAIMIRDDDRLIGWSLVMPREGKERGYEAMFYVRHSHRRQGYGTILMDRVRRIDPIPYVFPHDRTSGDFFKKSKSIRCDQADRFFLK